jgi:hypothetical protein
VFSNVGFFGNLSNSDLATETLSGYTPRNCFYGNTDSSGSVTSEPDNIQSAGVDGQPCAAKGSGIDLAMAAELACATPGQPCLLPSFLADYPGQSTTVMMPLPNLQSMPQPCAGVPANPFCP